MMRFSKAAASVAMVALLLVPMPASRAADQPAAKPDSSSDTYRQLDLFGEVFERGDLDFGRALVPGHLERLGVHVRCLAGGAEVPQHPASEVDCPAGEPGHLPAFDLGGVAGERGQSQRRLARERVRVTSEQQRVQRR